METYLKLGLIPLLVGAISIVLVAVFHLFSEFVFNPPNLLLTLNLVFIAGTNVAVAVLCARSYLMHGSPNVLGIGSALLVSGLTALSAGLASLFSVNANVMIFNVGILTAALLQVLAASLTSSGISESLGARFSNKALLTISYLGVGGFVAILIGMAVDGLFPVFFTSSGPTMLREVVLAVAAAFFGLAFLVFGRLYLRAKASVLYWYSLGLGSVALGLFGSLFVTEFGGAVAWLARMGQYVGGLYFLLAIMSLREMGDQGIGFVGAWSEAFRSDRAQISKFFSSMLTGFAYCRILTDRRGIPVDYVYLDVNDAFEKITGKSKESVMGKRATVVFPDLKKDPGGLIGTYGRIALNMESAIFEDYWEEGEKWYRVSAYSPRRGYFISISEDITESKIAQQEIADVAKFPYENPNIIIRVDKDSTILYCNPAGQFLLREWKANVGESAPAVVSKRVTEALMSQKRVEYEGKYGDQSYAFMLVPIIGRQYVNIYGLDITERKKAEEKIRESEEHLRALSDLTTEGIVIHEKGTVLVANDALARMFGYISASETIGMSGFPMVTPESQKKMKEHIARGSEETYELTGIRKDGTLFPIEIRARNMLYQGRLVRVGSIFDITERKKAEETLKDTTQKYGLLFDTTSDGVWIHNLKGQILEVNDAYCHMSGYTRAELIGMPISKLEAVETPEEIAVHIKKVLASGGHDRFESRHRRKDGSVFDTDITALYLEREGGQIAIFVRDITQRKKAEEALRESEKKFKTLAENAPDAIMRFDTNLRVLYLNPQDIAATGIPLAEFIGKTNEETGMPKELVKLWNEMFDRAKITKQGQQTEFDFSTHTGTRTFSLRIVPEFAEDGSLISYMGISRDITERKKAEEALKESEARFRTMADGTPSMLWVTDKEGKNQFVNRYFQLYFGVSSEQVEEIKWLRLLHPEDASHYVERFLEAVKEHRSFTAQARVRRTDGVWRWVETIATARYSPQGEFLGHVGITSDITEQKEAQQRLEEYSKNLEKTVEERTRQLADADRLAAIGATAGMVGHDIRNPLQAIEAAVYLSKHEIKGLPKQALVRKNLEEILNSISEQASYMNKIISDLQDFAGTPKPHIEELDIKDTLTSALSEIQIPMNVEILRIIPQSLPKMKGDKVYIRRTLTNLITNAIQAMPDGGTLTLKIIRDKHEDFVKVSIKDTGTGISKENQQKIFKPLFTTKAKGQGFGLAVAKKLVQAQGGELTFRSREGRGTTFTLRMPSSRGEMMNKNAE